MLWESYMLYKEVKMHPGTWISFSKSWHLLTVKQFQENSPPPKGNSLYCQNLLERLLSGRKSFRTQRDIQSILGKRAKLVGCTSEGTSQRHNVADNTKSKQHRSRWYDTHRRKLGHTTISRVNPYTALRATRQAFPHVSDLHFGCKDPLSLMQEAYCRTKFPYMLIRRKTCSKKAKTKQKTPKHTSDLKKLLESSITLHHTLACSVSVTS